MTDWADKLTRDLAGEDYDTGYVFESVAAALRKAKADGLREAAVICDKWESGCANNVWVFSVPMVGANETLRLVHSGGEQASGSIALEIRALADKIERGE